MAAIYTRQSDGTLIYHVTFSVAVPQAVNDEWEMAKLQIQYKPSTESTWNNTIYVLTEGDTTADFSLGPVSPNVTYDYRLRFVNKFNYEGTWYTSTFTVDEKVSVPAAATGLAVTQINRGLRLDWSLVADKDAKLYRVHRHTADVFGSSTVIANVSTDTYIDTDVTDGTTYYYWLVTEDTSGLVSTNTSSVNATATVDDNKAFRQASAPVSGMKEGDLWFDSDDNNTLYVYTGSAWEEAEVQELAASKITSGTISAHTITLDTASSAIESSNFSSGSAGFQIQGDGSAEFNDVTIRGTLASSDSVANSGYADKVMRGVNALWSQDTSPPNTDWTTWTDAGSTKTFYKYSSTDVSANSTNRYKYDSQTFLLSLTGIVDLSQNAEQSSGRTAEIELQYRIDSGSWTTIAPTTTKYHLKGTSTSPGTAQSHTQPAQVVVATLDLSTATDKVDFKMRQKGKGLVQMTMSITALNI